MREMFLFLGLLILASAVTSANAESPKVKITNVSRRASTEFQIGDRFEIVITSAANEPVSLRTTRNGRIDWGPVIGWTDLSGRWATEGLFEKSDFGDWNELWTVGGRLAKPAVHFQVNAPCREGGQGFATQSGTHVVLNCETAEGLQSFATPSTTDPVRTRDGRMVPGMFNSDLTPEQYHSEIIASLITSSENNVKSGQHGNQAGALIAKMVGANALSEGETRNVLSIIEAAYEYPDRIPQSAKDPSETLTLLQKLADSADQQNLKKQITDTITFIQSR